MMCSGKVAIVTGAAGSGMGRSIALTLAREGARVVVNYRTSADSARAIGEHIGVRGGQAVAVQADVFTAEGCRKLFDVACEVFGRVDICVIGPGAGWHGEPIDRLAPEAVFEDVQHELAPFLHLMPLVLPGMYERRWGRIIGIAMHPTRLSPAYAYNLGKAARIQAFLLAQEQAWRAGVTMNVIAPGPVTAIPSLADAVALCDRGAAWAGRGDISPQDIAEGVAFLCSEAGRFVTGSVMPYMFNGKGGSSMHANLSRHIAAGQIIKPWLILGPFYEDLSATVQGLTLFEKPGAAVGRTAMTQIVGEAQAILLSRPREGEEATFRGQATLAPAQTGRCSAGVRWNLVRRPENYLSWGRYNISNHLGVAFLTTLLTPDQPGSRHWRLVLGITSRAIVAINGVTVYDTDAHPMKQADGVFEHRFEAALDAGENVVTVGLFRVGRMAQVGCRLETDVGVTAAVPLAAGMSESVRTAVEEQVASIRFARDVFYGDHELGFKLGAAPDPAAPLTVELVSDDGRVLHTARPTSAGPVVLCRGAALPDDHYELRCVWTTGNGQPLTATAYAVHKVTPVAPLVGQEHLAERRRRVLEHYADNQERDAHRIWTEVARYDLGQYDRVDESVIRDTCEFIAARKDCADFVIQGILRLMYWEREQERPRLSSQIHAMMKDTVLGFKYWVDEPGDTVMYMGSENHRLLFHVAEWLAGQLFPTEEFTNSRQNGLFHYHKAYVYITEWLRQRGRFGFDEWHSNSYYPICIAPLINLYDFAQHEGQYKLRQMTGAVLDYMFFNIAADSLNGVLGTTHGRSYGIYVKYPDFEGTSALCWLLFGVGSLSKRTSGIGPVPTASSLYQVPKILADIATDGEAVVESKIRQGILRTSAHHADFAVYRTPDYLLSGLQDHRKGEYESSTHVAQVTLGNKVVIFWSCPHTSGEGSGLRPDYWSGHTTLPRVIQHRNVMSLTWRLTWRAWMSHCFFEQERFDEVRFVARPPAAQGAWAFARVGGGYVGIYSQHGFVIGAEGQYAGRELQCAAPENTWLVECGREADWGTFEAFVNALKAAPIEAKNGVIAYTSPSVGTFVTGWDVKPTVNGAPIQLHGYPMVDSPWAHADFGSGELVIRHGDEEYEIWFNQ